MYWLGTEQQTQHNKTLNQTTISTANSENTELKQSHKSTNESKPTLKFNNCVRVSLCTVLSYTTQHSTEQF